MRVAVFADNNFDHVNAVTTSLTALVDNAPADVSPRIYTASSLGVDDPQYFALRSVPMPFLADVNAYFPRYRDYLRRVLADKIDVLHAATRGPMGLTARWIAARTGMPLVASIHGSDPVRSVALRSRSKLIGALHARYLRLMYERCHRTLVPAAVTRELLIRSGLAPGQIVLCPGGVDTTHFAPERRSPRLRARWRVSEQDVVLLYAGRLSYNQGLETLDEILYRLRAMRIRHRMIIAGDGPYRKPLEEQVPDAVFTGRLDGSDLADVLASADVFVLPGASETPGYEVLAAQASGSPVIVGAAAAAKEQLVPDVTGLVCENTDPRRWAVAIASIACNVERRVTMGRAARQYALDRRWNLALAPLYEAYRGAAYTTRHAIAACPAA